MFEGFNLEGQQDDGEIHGVRIMVGNVTSSIVCPPFLLKQMQDAFSYEIADADKIRDHRIAHHMKEADKASLENNKRQEAYHIRKAEEAQEWDAMQTLFNKTHIGTGMLEDLLMWIEEHGHSYEVIDRMEKPVSVTITKKNMYDLWDEQKVAMERLVEYDYRGILQGATAFGKTVVGTHIIFTLQTPTIIIADRQEYSKQWVKQIKNAFDLTHETIKGTEAHFFFSHYHTRPVIMITTSSLLNSAHKPTKNSKLKLRNSIIMAMCKKAGLMIYDEAHHAAMGQGKFSCYTIKSYYRVGLTATANMRSDGKDPEYLASIGQVIYYLPPSKLVDLGLGKSVTIRGVTINYPFGELEDIRDSSEEYDELYDNFIIHNDTRNREIGTIVLQEAMEGNCILVLVDRLDQARAIALAVGFELGVFTWGSDDKRTRNEKIRRFRAGEVPALICTHNLVGEGFDVPRINRMIITGGKAEMKTLQAVGRCMRLSEHKEAIVYDIIDPIAPFSTHFLHRLEVYQSESSFVIENDGVDLPRWVQNYLY